MSYFDKHATGGHEASKVDQQDAVAIHCALTLIAEGEMFDVNFEKTTQIALEQIEDVVLQDSRRRIAISVKSSELSASKFKAEIDRLDSIVNNQTFDLAILASIDGKGEAFRKKKDQLLRLANLLPNKNAAEQAQIRAEFQTAYGPYPVGKVDLLAIADLDSKQFRADVARLLRKCLPIIDYTDDRVDSIIMILEKRLAIARRQGESVSVEGVRRDVLEAVAHPAESTIMEGMPYLLVKGGYRLDHDKSEKLKNSYWEVIRARRKMLNKYRRSHFSTAVRWMTYQGAPSCYECRHPLVANLCGLGIGGVGCPNCGLTPFVTLFYVCACGGASPLMEQPPLSDYVQFNIKRAAGLKELNCSVCKSPALLEEVNHRIFQLNIPADEWGNLDGLLMKRWAEINAQ